MAWIYVLFSDITYEVIRMMGNDWNGMILQIFFALFTQQRFVELLRLTQAREYIMIEVRTTSMI